MFAPEMVVKQQTKRVVGFKFVSLPRTTWTKNERRQDRHPVNVKFRITPEQIDPSAAAD